MRAGPAAVRCERRGTATMSDDIASILRNIPQVEKILQDDDVARFVPVIGRDVTVAVIRDAIDDFRRRVESGASGSAEELRGSIIGACGRKRLEKLQRVVNGTGVIIHTNLGRSPLRAEILQRLAAAMPGYCNLEVHLPTGERGKRGGFAEELACHLTGAQDALIVNNNAASVFLILHAFAAGREAIVSRGELVQIGGGFRIPDIMRQTGARLVEVGTTNITELDDFKRAITPDTAMILSVHQSNFRQKGFVRQPTLRELASLASDSVLFVRDLGSGNLIRDERLPLSFEPEVRFEVAQGPDLVCFSGDKLLGSCQAGIIVGRRDLIAQLRKHPLMRALRVDKISYFILQETLLAYMNERGREVGVWSGIFQDRAAVAKKIERTMKRITHERKKEMVARVECKSTFGGGSMPGYTLQSVGVQIDVPGLRADDIDRALTANEVPIVGFIADGKYTLDFRTVLEEDIPVIVQALTALFSGA